MVTPLLPSKHLQHYRNENICRVKSNRHIFTKQFRLYIFNCHPTVMGNWPRMFRNLNRRRFKCIIIQKQEVFVYETAGLEIYLLGTSHTSEKSVKAIEKLIDLVRPQVVAVELCHERLRKANLFKDRAKFERRYRDLLYVPDSLRKIAVGELSRVILTYQALQQRNNFRKPLSLGKCKYKVKPIYIDESLTIGGDVFAPFKNFVWSSHTDAGLSYLSTPEAPYKITLADRPIGVTCAKLAKALSQDEKMVIRAYKKDFLGMFFENQHGIMKQIWKRNEDVRKIMVMERDKFLAESILKSARLPKRRGVGFSRVVGIVGRAHIDGILAQWIKKPR